MANEDSDDDEIYESDEQEDVHVDWQTGKTLPDRLLYTLSREILTDVTFHVGPKQAKIKAHKNLLASISPVFFTMFTGPMAEGNDVTVPDIEAKNFKEMLRMLYTDRYNITEKNVYGLLYCAEKYLLQAMKEHCVQFLFSMIDSQRVWSILQTGIDFSLDDLKAECLRYVSKDTVQYLRTNECLNAPKDVFAAVISYERLSCKEEFVYESCMQWAENQCKVQNLPKTDENLRAVLGELVNYIRFPLMDVEYFARNIATRHLLSKDEILSVFQSIHTNEQGLFSSEKRKQTIRLYRNLSHSDGTMDMIKQYMNNSGQLFAVADLSCKTTDINLHGVIVFVPPSPTIKAFVSICLKRSGRQFESGGYYADRPIPYEQYREGKMNFYGEDLAVIENYTLTKSQETHDVPLEREIKLRKNVWYTVEATISFQSASTPGWGSAGIRNRMKYNSKIHAAYINDAGRIENVDMGNIALVFRHIVTKDPGNPLIHTLISGIMVSEV